MPPAVVALATCLRPPEPDTDEPLLRAALASRDLDVAVAAWDQPAAAEVFDRAAACVIRSTWNYAHDHEGFLAWTERVAARAPLWNPAPVVAWNSHKGYLMDLAKAGVAVVPTLLMPRGRRPSLADVFELWPEIVVKPAVSAGSFGTIRADRWHRMRAEAHLHRLGATRDMMVQPFLRDVDDAGRGERALVFIDGAFSHAVCKHARFAGDDERVAPAAVVPAADELALAEAALAAVPDGGGRSLLYARVDLVRDDEGVARIMELELIEPSLFLGHRPAAADLLAAAIAARL